MRNKTRLVRGFWATALAIAMVAFSAPQASAVSTYKWGTCTVDLKAPMGNYVNGTKANWNGYFIAVGGGCAANTTSVRVCFDYRVKNNSGVWSGYAVAGPGSLSGHYFGCSTWFGVPGGEGGISIGSVNTYAPTDCASYQAFEARTSLWITTAGQGQSPVQHGDYRTSLVC